jgi:hypothetical protein
MSTSICASTARTFMNASSNVNIAHERRRCNPARASARASPPQSTFTTAPLGLLASLAVPQRWR